MLKRLALFAAALFASAPLFAQQPVIRLTGTHFIIQERGTYLTYAVLTRDGDLHAPLPWKVSIRDVRTGHTLTSSGTFGDGFADYSVALNDSQKPLDDDYYNPGRGWDVTILPTPGATIGEPSSARYDVVDDEQPPRLSINDITVGEGNVNSGRTRATFTLQTSSLLDTYLTVPIAVHDGTAKAGSDYNVPQSTLAYFPPGESRTDVTIDVIPDNSPEGDETFTVELGQPSPGFVSIAKGTGTCTIVDDDGAVSPLSLRIAKGEKGTIQIRLTDPAPARETVLLEGGGAFVSFPASVDIPAGGSSADVDVVGNDAGSGTITVTLPPSRGGRAFSCSVLVYEPLALTIDPPRLTLPLGGSGSVTAKIDPPPAAPVEVTLLQGTPVTVEIPGRVTIDTKGTAAIPVRAIAAGVATVSVRLPELNGSATVPFLVDVTVPAGLAITNLSQRTGRASGGETVKVFGNQISGRCVVTFGGLPSQTSDLPANGAIVATTPPHDAGVVDVGIRCGSDSYVLPNAFTYTPSPLALASVTPAAGAARGGTIAVLRGTNLRTGLCTATFGGAAAHAIAWSGTASMTVVVPPHAAGAVPVTLTCGGDTATLANGFTFTAGDDAQATLIRFTPDRAAPGESVTIFGARFRPDDAISLGGTVADASPLTASDARSITVPELPPGVVPIQVRDAAGRTTAIGGLQIVAPPVPAIAQLDARVTVGAELAAGGTGFRSALTYALGLVVLKPVAMTSTRAVFRVPANVAAGPASFSISDGTTVLASRPVDVTTSGLAVAAVAPQCSVREGRVLATISGSGFDDGAMVQFGTTYAPGVVVRDRFTLVAEVPPAYGAGDVILTVTNPDGSAATLTSAFTYKSAAEGGCTSRHRAVGR